MSTVYVYENGSEIYHNENQIVIEYGELVRKIPINRVDNVLIFSHVNLRSSTVRRFLKEGISILWLSKTGRFFGKLISTSHVDIEKQRQQFRMGDNQSYVIGFTKAVIEAKIHNQITILQRFSRLNQIAVTSYVEKMKIMKKKVSRAGTVNEILGYEGVASRNYFSGLSQSMPEEFRFNGRSRRPPRDPFNSLISFGYTLLMYEVYTSLESSGLNPYAGMLHQDRRNHPALASDLIEEWRPVLIDHMVLAMITEGKVSIDMFDSKESGVFISKEGIKIFIHEYEQRMLRKSKYIEELEYRSDFRHVIMHQVEAFSRSLISENPEIYQPIKIR